MNGLLFNINNKQQQFCITGFRDQMQALKPVMQVPPQFTIFDMLYECVLISVYMWIKA